MLLSQGIVAIDIAPLFKIVASNTIRLSGSAHMSKYGSPNMRCHEAAI